MIDEHRQTKVPLFVKILINFNQKIIQIDFHTLMIVFLRLRDKKSSQSNNVSTEFSKLTLGYFYLYNIYITLKLAPILDYRPNEIIKRLISQQQFEIFTTYFANIYRQKSTLRSNDSISSLYWHTNYASPSTQVNLSKVPFGELCNHFYKKRAKPIKLQNQKKPSLFSIH